MRTLSLVLAFLTLSFAIAAEGEKHALLIGVQQYTDEELGNLLYAENDVKELAEVLKKQGYTEGNVHLLTVSNAKATDTDNLRPTAKNIASWLKYLCKNAKPQDTVLIAFAGHGIELNDPATNKHRSFFCPLEASLKDEKTLVPIKEFFDDLDVKCKAHVKLLVMDACRKSRFSRDASLTMPLIPDLPGGIVALFSCGKGQKAYESDVFKHGIFFHFFIEGLKGACANAEGEVTLPLLEDYVTRQVPRTVVLEQKNPEAEQYPERRGQMLGQLVLAKGAYQKTAPVVAPPTSVIATRPPENENELMIDLGKGVTMDFVRVKAGTFQMGSDDSDADASPDEKPAHTVKISRDYFIGKYPVTVGQFRRFVDETSYRTEAEKAKGGYTLVNKDWKIVESASWKNPGFDQSNDHPVVLVSWNDTQAFLQWACTQAKREVRLPSEAEWEYAARGSKNVKYPWGNYFDGTKCNHADLTLKNSGLGNDAWTYSTTSDGYVFTSPVGRFDNASWCGARDMSGNVWQWCQDKYEDKYYQSRPNLDVDPKGPSTGYKVKGSFDDVETEARVLRGGSWFYLPSICRSAFRLRIAPSYRFTFYGFRCVLPVD
ncbi:MAG: SUMF1/EgtB/PvdO family nonheme iron enzyme [Planctomycetota bacterium]